MTRVQLLKAGLVVVLLVNSWGAIGRLGFFANRHLGEQALAEARLDDALRLLRASLWWQPDNAPGHVLMGRAVHLAMANGLRLEAWPGAGPEELLAAAATLVGQGVDHSPADAWAWFNLAEVYRSYQRGVARRELLQSGTGSVETGARHGHGALQEGDGIIIAASLRAEALEPSFFFYRDFLGNLYLRRGLRDEAAAEFRESFRLMPLRSAHGTLSDEVIVAMSAAVEEGVVAAARELHVGPALMARSRAELFQVLDRKPEAIEAWQELRRGAAEEVQVESDYQVARLYQEMGRDADSLPLLRTITADGGGGSWRPSSLLLLGRGLSRQGRHEEALSIWAEYREAMPHSFRPLIYMARERELMGDIPEATRLYRAAARRFASEEGAWANYIEHLLKHGETAEAQREAREFLRRMPGSERAQDLASRLREDR